MDEAERLLELKEEVESRKLKTAELSGRKGTYMDELKKDWKCTSIEKAKELRKGKVESYEKITNQLSDGLDELEEKYDLE